jgi:hypothetical protein
MLALRRTPTGQMTILDGIRRIDDCRRPRLYASLFLIAFAARVAFLLATHCYRHPEHSEVVHIAIPLATKGAFAELTATIPAPWRTRRHCIRCCYQAFSVWLGRAPGGSRAGDPQFVALLGSVSPSPVGCRRLRHVVFVGVLAQRAPG